MVLNSEGTTKAIAHCKNFRGCRFFRQHIILSILSGRPVHISNIRPSNEEPGIRDYEIKFLALLEKATNGTKFEVGQTGTSVYCQPGILVGGDFEHDCGTSRGIGYYLEYLIILAPFCKKVINVTLRGVTHHQKDVSVDSLSKGFLKFVCNHMTAAKIGLEVKVKKRGVVPGGGGEVLFTTSLRPKVSAVQFVDAGKVKTIRGIAFAVHCSPGIANRMVQTAKGQLLKATSDVYISTDHYKGSTSNKSPGFGISLIAETYKGAYYTADVVSPYPVVDEKPPLPEDLAITAVNLLMEDIYRGGCISTVNQNTFLILMALGQQNVSKVVMGPLTFGSMQTIKHIQVFLGVTFKLESSEKSDDETDLHLGTAKVMVTTVGVGYTNLSKPVS